MSVLMVLGVRCWFIGAWRLGVKLREWKDVIVGLGLVVAVGLYVYLDRQAKQAERAVEVAAAKKASDERDRQRAIARGEACRTVEAYLPGLVDLGGRPVECNERRYPPRPECRLMVEWQRVLTMRGQSIDDLYRPFGRGPMTWLDDCRPDLAFADRYGVDAYKDAIILFADIRKREEK